MTVTIQQLAQELKLSTATVSRAINNPESVSEPNRSRVLELVETYQYRPDAIARSLRVGRNKSIGLIVSDIRNPFYATITKAVEDVARQYGYGVLICNADENPERANEALSLLLAQQISGLIHVPTGENHPALARMVARGIPVIELDRSSGQQEASSVLADNLQGAGLAARHLLDLGHQRIATIAGPLHLTTGRERLEGFRTTLEQAGCALPWQYIEVGDFREASGVVAARRLLSLDQPPTALFVANNEMMAGVLTAVFERGWTIPDQISLVCFDDARWAQYMKPALTVVDQPIAQLGSLAAERLFQRLNGAPPVAREMLQTRLIVRGSTGPPPP